MPTFTRSIRGSRFSSFFTRSREPRISLLSSAHKTQTGGCGEVPLEIGANFALGNSDCDVAARTCLFAFTYARIVIIIMYKCRRPRCNIADLEMEMFSKSAFGAKRLM